MSLEISETNRSSIAQMILFGYEVFRATDADEVGKRFGAKRKAALKSFTGLDSPNSKPQRVMIYWPNEIFAFATEDDLTSPERITRKYIHSGFGSSCPYRHLTAACLPFPRGWGNIEKIK